MRRSKKKRLERKGWRFGTVQDFLGLSDEEARLVELAQQLADAKNAAERARLRKAVARVTLGK